MATPKYPNRNVGSIITTAEDGQVREIIASALRLQFVKNSFTINPSSSFSTCSSSPIASQHSTPSTPPSSEDIPSSMCMVCGSSQVEMSDGQGHCNDCGSQFSLGGSVTAHSFKELTEGMEEFVEEIGEELITFIKEEKQQYPIMKYKDIVSDKINRFKILDL